MKNSGVIPLNKAKLDLFIKLKGNTPEGQLATQYRTAVNTLKEEFANLANGGYAPTDPAWELANEQINSDYGVDQLLASNKEIKRLINYRLHSSPAWTRWDRVRRTDTRTTRAFLIKKSRH